VRAAGVNPSDWKKRKGLMYGKLPQTIGYEAAGVVDELGDGVVDVAVGDRVFGFSAEGAAARCSSTVHPEASAAPRFSSPWCAVRA
jgi:NADPH:quinone reductase-like Zn-dependent oxidoreductase